MTLSYINEANSLPNIKEKQAYYHNLANSFEWLINQLGGRGLSADLKLHGSPETYGVRKEKQA